MKIFLSNLVKLITRAANHPAVRETARQLLTVVVTRAIEILENLLRNRQAGGPNLQAV